MHSSVGQLTGGEWLRRVNSIPQDCNSRFWGVHDVWLFANVAVL